MRRELVERRAVMNRHAVGAENVKNRALENMRKRQNRQRTVGIQNRQSFGNADNARRKIFVRQHHAFRLAGRAGSVNNRR
jgi:hypothetical protein